MVMRMRGERPHAHVRLHVAKRRQVLIDHFAGLFFKIYVLFQVEVMATRKIGRGKGALRCVNSPPVPGSIASAAAALSPSPSTRARNLPQLNRDELLEVRVTGIIDLTSFWIQMGTGKRSNFEEVAKFD